MTGTLLARVLTPLYSGGLLRNAGSLMLGTLLSQAIVVAASPLLSRIYNPADFGVFGSYLAITNFLLAIATGRYESAILLPAVHKQARLLRQLAILVAATISVVIALVIVVDKLAGGRVAAHLKLGELIWMVPVTALLLGVHQANAAWWLRFGKYARLSASRIARSGAAVGAQVSFALLGVGASGLVIGQAIGHLVAVVVTSAGDRAMGRVLRRSARLRAIARRYSRFPRFELPQVAFNSLSQQLPIVLLMILFGAEVTGSYVMASRVLIAPLALVGQALRPVIARHASAPKSARQPVFPLVSSACVLLFAIGIVPTVVLAVFGVRLFEWVFSSSWNAAGVYASLMAPWLLVLLMKESVLGLIPALSLQKLALYFEVVGLPARALAIFIGAELGGAVGAVGAFAAVGVISNVLLIALLLRAAKLRDREAELAGQAA